MFQKKKTKVKENHQLTLMKCIYMIFLTQLKMSLIKMLTEVVSKSLLIVIWKLKDRKKIKKKAYHENMLKDTECP